MAFDVKRVSNFGGGLNFSGHPADIADNEWSFSNGFFAKDGYAEMCTAIGNLSISAYLLGTHTAADIFGNPFDSDAAYVTSSASTGNVGAIYDVDLGAATATNLTPTGGAVFAENAGAFISSAAMLENELYVSMGVIAVGTGRYGILRITPTAGGAGPAVYTRIDQVSGAEVGASLTAGHLEVCRDHLIAAAVNATGTGSTRDMLRRMSRCDTLRGNKWLERLWNSSKTEEITELDYPITGMARADADTVLVTSVDRILSLRYTGSNPPFTRSNAADQIGHTAGKVGTGTGFSIRGGVARTALGVVYTSDDNVYIWGGQPQPIGDKIRRYFKERVDTPDRILKPVWHAHWGLLIVPVQVGSNLELFYYDPMTKAWSRRIAEPGTTTVSHAFIPTSLSADATYRGRYVMLTSAGAVHAESTASPPAGFSGAFVDTKDFTFEDRLTNDYVDRIAVDWEPLTNASTDAITVQALTRDDFSTVLGSLGGDTSGFSFTTIGTLTAGNSELECRLRGKFVRLRFLQSSGRVRIRGFTLRWLKGSDRSS